MQPASTNLAGLAAQQWVLILLLLAALVALSLPLTARSRLGNARDEVSRDLMVIISAREKYGLEYNLSPGTTVTVQQLLTDGKYLKELPPALQQSEIRLGPVGGRIACKVGNAWFDPLPTNDHPAPTPEPL